MLSAPGTMHRFRTTLSKQKRHVGEDDAPSFREANPRLTLPAASKLALDVALKGHGDTGEVLTEADDLKPRDGARQFSWGTPFTESLDFADAIQRLGRAKARDVGGGPEHTH